MQAKLHEQLWAKSFMCSFFRTKKNQKMDVGDGEWDPLV